MSSNPYYPEPNEGDEKNREGSPGSPGSGDVQQVRHRAVGARVPEGVGRGVFSTGAIIMTGASEFVLDFVQRMGRPYHIVARVVMPHGVLPRFIEALTDNLKKFEERFGPPPAMPKPPENQKRPSIQEVYDDLKMSDDVLSGSFANGVLIGHSPAEFCFDFITNFFPTSAVSKRVFLSAPQTPVLLDSLKNTWKQYQNRAQNPPPPQAPPPQTPPSQEGEEWKNPPG